MSLHPKISNVHTSFYHFGYTYGTSEQGRFPSHQWGSIGYPKRKINLAKLV